MVGRHRTQRLSLCCLLCTRSVSKPGVACLRAMVEWLSSISTLAGGTWVRQVERQTIERSRVVALDGCLLTLVIAPPLSIFLPPQCCAPAATTGRSSDWERTVELNFFFVTLISSYLNFIGDVCTDQ